jgi:hypothetical protein
MSACSSILLYIKVSYSEFFVVKCKIVPHDAMKMYEGVEV